MLSHVSLPQTAGDASHVARILFCLCEMRYSPDCMRQGIAKGAFMSNDGERQEHVHYCTGCKRELVCIDVTCQIVSGGFGHPVGTFGQPIGLRLECSACFLKRIERESLERWHGVA
jgi:hypothetical protein